MEKAAKIKLHQAVLSQLDARKIGLAYGEDIDRCRRRAEEIINEEMSNASVSQENRDSFRKEMIDEIFGYGPITPLLEDPSVSEIMVNGKDSIYLEREGRLARHNNSFLSEESLRVAIDRMVARVNRRLDESSPYVDARLPDGSRINAIIPPVSLTGACLTIRKFRKEAFSLDELVRIGSLSQEASEYLREAVLQRKNIIVSGGTGSGKTTLLNALSGAIPEDERIVTIEDSAELRLQKPHVIRLESRPPNIEGGGAVMIRDLVRNSLRMRPDRIIVGECRGGEALDMLQAMNTGHDGSITTGHANTPRDMLRRLETMTLLSGMELPIRAIREQIASAIHLVIHTSRIKGGKRAVTSITEISGMNDSQILIQEIFRWGKGNDAASSENRLVFTGIPSRFAEEESSLWD
ncbi:MAG: CpaF family protein [Syntrophorhabdaceae bacterium]|nr:CpaF family protein [Syntrophorhabdaceae bacterium]